MNRWHVFEYLKNLYMDTGKEATRREVVMRFGDEMDLEEIQEGYEEYQTVKGRGHIPCFYTMQRESQKKHKSEIS